MGGYVSRLWHPEPPASPRVGELYTQGQYNPNQGSITFMVTFMVLCTMPQTWHRQSAARAMHSSAAQSPWGHSGDAIVSLISTAAWIDPLTLGGGWLCAATAWPVLHQVQHRHGMSSDEGVVQESGPPTNVGGGRRVGCLSDARGFFLLYSFR